MFIDTHCHLDDEKFNNISDVVKQFENDGVDYAISMGCNAISSCHAMNIAEKYQSVYFAAGFHPSDSKTYDNDGLIAIERMARHDKCVAIGEIGLDYYWEGYDKDLQRKCFIEQLELAKQLRLPVSIHSRNATEDMINILSENKQKITYGGVLHCFSGSVETSKIILDLGLYISFAGPITFKNAGKLLEVAKYVPESYCLTETDSPYLAPHPLRGSINQPKNVGLVTAKLSQIKDVDVQYMSNVIMNNAKRLFSKIK